MHHMFAHVLIPGINDGPRSLRAITDWVATNHPDSIRHPGTVLNVTNGTLFAFAANSNWRPPIGVGGLPLQPDTILEIMTLLISRGACVYSDIIITLSYDACSYPMPGYVRVPRIELLLRHFTPVNDQRVITAVGKLQKIVAEHHAFLRRREAEEIMRQEELRRQAEETARRQAENAARQEAARRQAEEVARQEAARRQAEEAVRQEAMMRQEEERRRFAANVENAMTALFQEFVMGMSMFGIIEENMRLKIINDALMRIIRATA